MRERTTMRRKTKTKMDRLENWHRAKRGMGGRGESERERRRRGMGGSKKWGRKVTSPIGLLNMRSLVGVRAEVARAKSKREKCEVESLQSLLVA